MVFGPRDARAEAGPLLSASGRAGGELLPGLAACLLVALALSPALSPGRVLFHRDLGRLMQPLIENARTGPHAALPFWSHASAEGRPLLANPGLALLAPPAVLWALLPHEDAFDLFLVVHAMLGAAGAAALARRLGVSRIGAFLAGATLGLGGGTLSALDLYWALVAFGWAPWVLCAGVAACEIATPARLALLALALALQADGGMPEVVLATLLVGALLGLAVAPGGVARRLARVAWSWGLSGLTAIALAAPQLLPAAMHARTTLRGLGFTAAGVLYNSLDPRALPGLAWPRWGGSTFDRLLPGGYPGALWTDSGSPYLVTIYCGAGCLALAVIAVALAGRKGVVLALAAAATAGVLLASGRHLPGATTLVEALAPLPLRYPTKALFATFLAVPLLAAFGLDALAARAGLRRSLVAAMVAACVLDVGLASLGCAPTMERSALESPPLAGWLEARARALGVPARQWRLHHERFPAGEWPPPAHAGITSPEAMQLWQRRMLMPPTGAAHGIHHAFDPQPDQLESLEHFEATRELYAQVGGAWARALGEAAVLFVVSKRPDLPERSNGLLVRERALGPEDGLPPGSGYLFRNAAFRPRLAGPTGSDSGGPVADRILVGPISEDQHGLSVQLRAQRGASLVLRDCLPELEAWTASLSDGRALRLERTGHCQAVLAVPEGDWTLRLQHRPPGWRSGLIASGLAWILVLAAFSAAWLRRRSG